MPFEFDPAKDISNQAKHGVSLALAADLEWGDALVWLDERRAYGEARQSALVPLADRLYYQSQG
jgi:uncharacterized DUF497 family protein